MQRLMMQFALSLMTLWLTQTAVATEAETAATAKQELLSFAQQIHKSNATFSAIWPGFWPDQQAFLATFDTLFTNFTTLMSRPLDVRTSAYVTGAILLHLLDSSSSDHTWQEHIEQGGLEIVEEPSRSTTAIGSISVADGSYELYGQELKIDRGSFIYNGGDVSNPGLDLRVKRDISNGNIGSNVNVGAQVVGTLVEPDFRLFSTPAMPDSEILSYLILGKSMQSASSTNSSDIQLQALLMLGAKGTEAIGESLQDTFGIDEFGIDTDPNTRETSFYIGKYLSPKLFVKYGVGLLESTNTFMVRYQLTERLLIETMANSQAQGGDIFYTFER